MDIENIGIAAIVENPEQGKYLLVKETLSNETSNKSENELSFVVGKTKPGESFIEALKRELLEEAQITDFEVKGILKILHFVKGHVVVLFLVQSFEPGSSTNIWVTRDELLSTQNLRSNVLDTFKLLESGIVHNLHIIDTVK